MTHQVSNGTGHGDVEATARYTTIPELADMMRLSRSLVYQLVASGRWPSHKAGGRLFFTAGDVAEIHELTRQPRMARPTPRSARPRTQRTHRRRTSPAGEAEPQPDGASSHPR